MSEFEERSVDMGEAVEMRFCRIPEGSFRMGCRGDGLTREEPVHRVTLSDDYWLGKYPLTQEQFAGYRDDHENGFPNHPQRPAENMDWPSAWGFGDWFQENFEDQIAERFGTGIEFARLPTEAEWEYGCRAGTETDYSSGDGEEALRRVGWYDGNADGSTHEVGELASNERGLHDMHGNVWEWCADAWEDGVYRQRAGGDEVRCQSGEKGAGRVVRGGSWFSAAGGCRAACRFGGGPGNRNRIRGFRLGLFPGPEVFPVNSKQQAETGTAESQPGGGSGAGAAAQRKPKGRDAARLAEIDDAEDNPA